MSSDNAPIGFALVMAAGASTGIGAAVVFNQKLVELASKQVLAAGLGLSAGVMLYVSFVEIFGKSLGGFQDSGYSEEDAYLCATVCFFAGVLMMKLVDKLVHMLDPDIDCCAGAGCTDLQQQTDSNAQGNGKPEALASSDSAAKDPSQEGANTNDVSLEASADHKPEATKASDKKLKRMGLNTALAIAIHNFPEGLATFVATVDDPAVGATLAIAIAIHNIPEGLCVSVPVFYSTGHRWKAFGWGVLSGISEPIGALLGWVILMNAMTDAVYGILFGIVAGMMVAIVLHELLPTAHRYDPKDVWVTNSVIAGMMIMSASLVMFLY